MRIVFTSLIIVFCLTKSVGQSTKDSLLRILEEAESSFETIESFDLFIDLYSEDGASDLPEYDDIYNGQDTSNKAIQSYLNALKYSTYAIAPYTIIELDAYYRDMLTLIGNSDINGFTDYNIVYEIDAITLIDGTVIPYQDVVSKHSIGKKYVQNYETSTDLQYLNIDTLSEEESILYDLLNSFHEYFLVKTTKPISAINFKVRIPVFNRKKKNSTSTSNIAIIGNDTLYIDSIVNHQVFIHFSDALSSTDFTIVGKYADGKALQQKGYAYNMLPTALDKAIVKALKENIPNAKQQILQGIITSEQALQDFFVPIKDSVYNSLGTANVQYYKGVLRFGGTIHEIDVFENMEGTLSSFQFILKVDSIPPFVIAKDYETELYGILDKDGQWLVQPQFDKYFRHEVGNFFTDQINDKNNTYFLDTKSKKIRKVDYHISNYDIIADKYIKVYKTINAEMGIANMHSGEIVLPIEFDYIDVQDGFWKLKKSDNTSIVDANFKTIIPYQPNNIQFFGAFFSVYKDGRFLNIFNRNGVNITRDRFDDVEGEFSDGLLLVEKYHYRAGNKSYIERVDQFFIDTVGNVVLDLNKMGFKNAQPFSAGMAPVQVERDGYNYIDPTGKIILSAKYRSAHTFYPTSRYAYVKLEDGTDALIDQQGNIIKTFTSGVYYWSRSAEDRKSRLQTYDKETFNEYGELVPEQ